MDDVLERDALDADLGEPAETLEQLVRRAGSPALAEALDGSRRDRRPSPSARASRARG